MMPSRPKAVQLGRLLLAEIGRCELIRLGHFMTHVKSRLKWNLSAGDSMKTKKALLAEKLTLEQAIQALHANAPSPRWIDRGDGSLSISVPISAADMKAQAALRAKLARVESQLGQPKAAERNTMRQLSSEGAELLTEQMLAHRWHCSISRLQRWRSASTGPVYLKIGGKVLYRMDDIRAYESASVVKPRGHA
jgi:hypothetical protein